MKLLLKVTKVQDAFLAHSQRGKFTAFWCKIYHKNFCSVFLESHLSCGFQQSSSKGEASLIRNANCTLNNAHLLLTKYLDVNKLF